jgi:hypothetical protein
MEFSRNRERIGRATGHRGSKSSQGHPIRRVYLALNLTAVWDLSRRLARRSCLGVDRRLRTSGRGASGDYGGEVASVPGRTLNLALARNHLLNRNLALNLTPAWDLSRRLARRSRLAVNRRLRTSGRGASGDSGTRVNRGTDWQSVLQVGAAWRWELTGQIVGRIGNPSYIDALESEGRAKSMCVEKRGEFIRRIRRIRRGLS